MSRKWHFAVLTVILAAVVAGVTGCAGSGSYQREKKTYYDAGWYQNERNKAHKMLPVEVMAADAVPEITTSHISNVPQSLAISKSLQAMANYNKPDAEKMGYDFPLSTVYEPTNLTRQLVRGHLYYVGLISFKIENQAAFKQMKGVMPGIVVVDAEDETKPAQLMLRKANGKPYQIMYHFRDVNLDTRYVKRYLRDKGYKITIATSEVYYDDITPEVDDQWNVYLTTTVNHNQFKVDKGWVMPKVEKVLVINAETGKIDEYKDPKQVPSWVDRIYSEDLVAQYINNWGWNPENYGINSEKGKVVVDDNALDVVVDAAARELVYVGVITSAQNDNSGLGVIVVPTRDISRAKYFPLYGERSIATRYHARQVINKVNQYRGWEVEDLTLHWLYSRFTWEGTYTMPVKFPRQSEGENTGDEYTGSTYMAIVLLWATSDLNGADVIWAPTKQVAFDTYEHHIFKTQTSNVGSFTLEENEAEGTIRDIKILTEQGQSVFFFHLVEPKYKDLTFRLVLDSTYDRDSMDIINAEPGHRASFVYGDQKNSPTCFAKRFKDLSKPMWVVRY